MYIYIYCYFFMISLKYIAKSFAHTVKDSVVGSARPRARGERIPIGTHLRILLDGDDDDGHLLSPWLAFSTFRFPFCLRQTEDWRCKCEVSKFSLLNDILTSEYKKYKNTEDFYLHSLVTSLIRCAYRRSWALDGVVSHFVRPFLWTWQSAWLVILR